MQLQFHHRSSCTAAPGRSKTIVLPARLEGCKAAALAGWQILTQGGSCARRRRSRRRRARRQSAVQRRHRLYAQQSRQSRDGRGNHGRRSLRAGAVAAVSGIKNPIKLARRVLEDGRHVMLAGEGALLFARADRVSRVRARIAHRRERKETLGKQAWHCGLRRFR